jgi:hypothetical protein
MFFFVAANQDLQRCVGLQWPEVHRPVDLDEYRPNGLTADIVNEVLFNYFLFPVFKCPLI